MPQVFFVRNAEKRGIYIGKLLVSQLGIGRELVMVIGFKTARKKRGDVDAI